MISTVTSLNLLIKRISKRANLLKIKDNDLCVK